LASFSPASRNPAIGGVAFTTLWVAVVASLVLSAVRLSYLVPESSLDTLSEAVRRDFREGDLLLVVPAHAVGVRQRLGDLPLYEPRHFSPDLLDGCRRVHLIELAMRGVDHTLYDELAARAEAVAERSFPGARTTTFRLRAPTRVVFDLRRDIEQLTVVAEYHDENPTLCDRFDRDRWTCPGKPGWNHVGRAIHDVQDELRECVWMHPITAGGKLRITLPPRPENGTLQLRGGFGFTRYAADNAAAPVRVRLFAGEQRIIDIEHPVGHTWHRIDQPFAATSEPLTLQLESDNNGAAHFCMALRWVEGEAE